MNKAIEVAAEWWANQLRGPAKQDNGDLFQSTFAAIIAEKLYKELPEEKIQTFKQNLIDTMLGYIKVEEQYGRKPEDIRNMGLHTDYWPDRTITEAAEKAGIEVTSTTFPIKTNMWVRLEDVIVSHGYGAPDETLYENPDHVTCSDCNGEGYNEEVCPACEGDSSKWKYREYDTEKKWPVCEDYRCREGKVNATCSPCNGRKKVKINVGE